MDRDGIIGDDDTAVLAFAAAEPSVLATVVSAHGSAPRGLGAHMAVRADGTFAGSVSGGCVEAAVIAEAQALLAGGPPRRLDYGIADDTAWSVGLACGGRTGIVLAKTDAAALAAILAEVARGNPAALVLDTETGAMNARTGSLVGSDTTGPLDDRGFLCAYGPPWRLVLVGAVHIAQALAPMAAAAGYAVTVVDPRAAFASATRFPGFRLICDWPDEALPTLRLDRRTALVVLGHDPRMDDPALIQALAAECFYIGALGSRRTHAARLKRLAGTGIERVSGPVGLDIGASNPAEIAVSILAEIIQRRRGRKWS